MVRLFYIDCFSLWHKFVGMTNAEFILQLIGVYYDPRRSRDVRDKDMLSLFQKYASKERQIGHITLADRITKILEDTKTKKKTVFTTLPENAKGLLEPLTIAHSKEDLVVSPALEEGLDRVCKEWALRDRLLEKGVTPSHKLLFYGKPGTGKTMTSSVLAHCLGLPLFRVSEGLIEGTLGKSQSNVNRVFQLINEYPGVYLFDEFDSIGMGRTTNQQEHAELRRTLNAFLQFMERTDSRSLLICATNMAESLDKALYRRFDQLWEFTLPDYDDRKRLIQKLTGVVLDDDMTQQTEGFSQSELTRWAQHAIRESLIDNLALDSDLLRRALSHLNQPVHCEP